jgi:MFS family permease
MACEKISTWSAMSILGVFRYTFLALRVSIPTCLIQIQMFYFGYLGGTFIAGRTLQRFHAGKAIAICFFLWGCTLLGCSAAKNYATLISLRFLLG